MGLYNLGRSFGWAYERGSLSQESLKRSIKTFWEQADKNEVKDSDDKCIVRQTLLVWGMVTNLIQPTRWPMRWSTVGRQSANSRPKSAHSRPTDGRLSTDVLAVVSRVNNRLLWRCISGVSVVCRRCVGDYFSFSYGLRIFNVALVLPMRW